MEEKKKTGLIDRLLGGIERAGNKMPDPVMIFIILIGIIILASWLLSMAGIEVVNPASGDLVQVESLLTRENIIRMIEEAVTNFTAFPALGLVLVVMLGIGLAEQSGYFELLLTSVVEKAPANLVLWVIIFVGILGNVAGDAAPIVIPTPCSHYIFKNGLPPCCRCDSGVCCPFRRVCR